MRVVETITKQRLSLLNEVYGSWTSYDGCAEDRPVEPYMTAFLMHDFLVSLLPLSAFFTQFLSTWMVPSEVPVALASGSITTCTIQGFLSHLFYGISACSNASLAVAYSGIVRFGWQDEIKGWRQLPFTGIPVLAGLVLAFVPVHGQNYNWNGGYACDVTASPLGCDWPGSTTTCTRGENALIMLGVTGIIPFVITFSIIVASMALLVHSVLTQERKMDRYSQQGQPGSRRMTKKTTRQGMYYILAFGVGWIPYFICESMHMFYVKTERLAIAFHQLPLIGF